MLLCASAFLFYFPERSYYNVYRSPRVSLEKGNSVTALHTRSPCDEMKATFRRPDKNRPFSQQPFFKGLCQECAPCHPVTWCPHSLLAHFVAFPRCLQAHARKHIPTCVGAQTSSPTRCTGEHMSARCAQQMALMLTLPLCCLFMPSVIPFYRFILPILGCNIDHGMVGLRGSMEVILTCNAS